MLLPFLSFNLNEHAELLFAMIKQLYGVEFSFSLLLVEGEHSRPLA